MPELPEVETTLRGIATHIEGKRIESIVVRQPQLRWPVPNEIKQAIGQRINGIRRRAKYLLLETDPGSIILHLGMSGSLSIQSADRPLLKHDHVDIIFDNQHILRLNDPRRFGACLWQAIDEPQLEILKNSWHINSTNVFEIWSGLITRPSRNSGRTSQILLKRVVFSILGFLFHKK